MMEEAYTAADEVIAGILKVDGINYSAAREEIARVFDEELWEGNYDASTDFENLPNLRLIQEDEYEQSMDEDEDRPDEDDQIGYFAGHYVFRNR